MYAVGKTGGRMDGGAVKHTLHFVLTWRTAFSVTVIKVSHRQRVLIRFLIDAAPLFFVRVCNLIAVFDV